MPRYLRLAVDNTAAPGTFEPEELGGGHNEHYGCLNIAPAKCVSKLYLPSQSHLVIVERPKLLPRA